MASIDQIRASDGSGNASVATVQSSRSGGSSTIVVDTVAGISDFFMGSMGTPHTFTDPITSETITVISEATAVDFSGHVDGANLEIDDIAPGYVDGGSEIGDIVIIRPTTQWGDNVADVLDVAHDDDGTLKAGAVDSAAVLASNVVTTAKILDANVTAAKLATPPSRFVALQPAVQVVSTDPANTNWSSVDITANTSATAYAAVLSMIMSSGGAGLYKGYIRKTGSAEAQGEVNAVVSNPSLAGPLYGETVVQLDSSQSFDWSVSNASVSQIIIIVKGYYELVA